MAPTPRGLVLSHLGLDHVGLDGAAVVQLVVICDGAASPVLQVQEGVRRLGTLRSLANAGQGVRSHVSVDRKRIAGSYTGLSTHQAKLHETLISGEGTAPHRGA